MVIAVAAGVVVHGNVEKAVGFIVFLVGFYKKAINAAVKNTGIYFLPWSNAR